MWLLNCHMFSWLCYSLFLLLTYNQASMADTEFKCLPRGRALPVLCMKSNSEYCPKQIRLHITVDPSPCCFLWPVMTVFLSLTTVESADFQLHLQFRPSTTKAKQMHTGRAEPKRPGMVQLYSEKRAIVLLHFKIAGNLRRQCDASVIVHNLHQSVNDVLTTIYHMQELLFIPVSFVESSEIIWITYSGVVWLLQFHLKCI